MILPAVLELPPDITGSMTLRPLSRSLTVRNTGPSGVKGSSYLSTDPGGFACDDHHSASHVADKDFVFDDLQGCRPGIAGTLRISVCNEVLRYGDCESIGGVFRSEV